ncbi:MAG: flagellar biosynthetic protein FliR [Myxococcota bacterium]|nr:flagellar biosynthetic protein FliR [Myxococcota bacterium]
MIPGAPTALLFVASLVAIRIGAALRLVPFMGGSPLPVLPWLALTAALTLIITPQAGPIPPGGFSAMGWVASAVKELFIGVIVGLLARIAFSVLALTGGFARLSSVSVPLGGDDTDGPGIPFARAYVLLGTGVFLLVGGHHAFLTGLAETIQTMPPGVFPGVGTEEILDPRPAIRLFCTAMGTAVLISAPVFLAGLSADVIIGLMMRATGSVAVPFDTQAIRAIAVQLAAVATLGIVTTVAIEFIQDAMAALN